MWNWLKRAFASPSSAAPSPKTVLDYMREGTCPDCGGKEFLEGPSGGMCQNIMCANPACGSKFNVGYAPFQPPGGTGFGLDPFFAERISEPRPLAVAKS